MTQPADRTQACGAAEARTRLRQAELYLEVARVVLSEEAAEHATVATGNAVLAAIAAADAIACASAGARYRANDHRRAAEYLEQVTGDVTLAGLLRDVIDLKDVGHYGLTNVTVSRAKSAVRKAKMLLTAARERVR
ncbi:MAG: hypothetical protein ACRDZ3_01800 [Acidimicrobiia bacterium]